MNLIIELKAFHYLWVLIGSETHKQKLVVTVKLIGIETNNVTHIVTRHSVELQR